MSKTFIRQEVSRYSKLGKSRRKLQKWRKPKGRDSKMRLRRKSYPASPSVGFKMPKKLAGLFKGKMPVLINNLTELEKLDKKSDIAVVSSRVGAKKKIEILKRAKESGISVKNAAKEETK